MKGVLNFRGEARRYVFHGVHMIFDGQLERPWNGGPRGNPLVFIGRKLDRQELEAGFEACVAWTRAEGSLPFAHAATLAAMPPMRAGRPTDATRSRRGARGRCVRILAP